MISESKTQRPPTLIVFWVIWFAIFNGLFIMQFLAAGGFPTGANKSAAPLWSVAVPAVALVIAMAIRFLVIPKISSLAAMLPTMVVGLALAEGVGIIGMFAVGKELPETRMALFITSVCAVIAYAPIYANALVVKEKMR